MFFLKNKNHLIPCHLVSSCKIEFPLQVQKKKFSGKTFFFASQEMKGSLTVEAAFVMPLVIFIIAVFSYLMMVMGLQVKLQEALDMAGRKLAAYSYVYEQIGEIAFEAEEEVMQKETELQELLQYGLNCAYAWKLVKDYVGEDWLEHYFILNGKNGIWIMGGDLLSEEDIIDLVLHYTIKIPYLPSENVGLPLVSRCRIKAWTGFEKKIEKVQDETEEEMVYVTETGKVYHTNINCSHLKLSIDEVDVHNLEHIRNQNGGKFYPCEYCFHKNTNLDNSGINRVFITKTGDRYHSEKGCSGLKRTVNEIPISQVGEKGKCQRCAQSEK